MVLLDTGIYFIYRVNLEPYGLRMNTECKECAFSLDDDGCYRLVLGGSSDCFVPMWCLWITDEVEL